MVGVRKDSEVKVLQYCWHACSEFTWLWSSPQFCTRNRESVQRGTERKTGNYPNCNKKEEEMQASSL